MIIILSFLCLFICWLLVAPVELVIDTETPVAKFTWVSIGSFRMWYEEEWWFSMRIFFFHKTMPFAKIKKKPAKGPGSVGSAKRRGKNKTGFTTGRLLKVARTLQVTEWQLAIDTGRFDMNARLYPLNFLSYNSGHLFINFQGTNFLNVKFRGQPWKIVYAIIF